MGVASRQMPRALVIAVVAASTLASTCTATDPGAPSTKSASEAPTRTPSSPSVPPSATPEARAWTRVTAPAGGTLLVRGRYPTFASSCVDPEQPVLAARYPGTVRVRLAEDGSRRWR